MPNRRVLNHLIQEEFRNQDNDIESPHNFISVPVAVLREDQGAGLQEFSWPLR